MNIIDRHGNKIQTSEETRSYSLTEKLLSVGGLIQRSNLDINGTIFVSMNEEEENVFMEYYQDSFWVRTFEEEPFHPITQDFTGALDSIVSKINDNHTNGWGRFVSCKGVEIQPEPLRARPLYGWIYIPIPQEIILNDGNRISITLSK